MGTGALTATLINVPCKKSNKNMLAPQWFNQLFAPCFGFLVVLVLQVCMPAVLAEAGCGVKLCLAVEDFIESSACFLWQSSLRSSQQIFHIISLPLSWTYCNLTAKALHLSLALSFLFFSFVSFSLSPHMVYCQTHALHLVPRICPIKKTLSLGFDDLLWHNLKLLFGFDRFVGKL